MRIEEVKIAEPCDAEWSGMDGDEKRRFCGSCAKHVHHLSGMSRREAEDVLAEREGEICVRYSATSDGELQFEKVRVAASAPLLQLAGARRLVASAVSLLAGTFVMQAVAMAQPPETYPLAGGIPPLQDPQPPLIPPKPPVVTPCGDEGSGVVEGSGAVEEIEQWMGEMPYEPGEPKSDFAERTKAVAEVRAIYRQERMAARILRQFGLTLDEVEIAEGEE